MSKKLEDLELGDVVLLTGDREGIIRYIGKVHFSKGIWYGIELSGGAVGSCDGAIRGRRYFQTDLERGIFVTRTKIGRKLREKDFSIGTRQRKEISLQSRPNNATSEKVSEVDLYLDNLSSTASVSPLSTPPPALDKKQSSSSDDKITPKSTYSNSNKDFEFDPPSRPQTKYEEPYKNKNDNQNYNNYEKKEDFPEQKVDSTWTRSHCIHIWDLKKENDKLSSEEENDSAGENGDDEQDDEDDEDNEDDEDEDNDENEDDDEDENDEDEENEEEDEYDDDEDDDEDEEEVVVERRRRRKDKYKKVSKYPPVPTEPLESEIPDIKEYEELLASVFLGNKNFNALPRVEPRRFDSEETDRLIGLWDVFFNNGLKGEYTFGLDEDLTIDPPYLHGWNNKTAKVTFDHEKKIYMITCDGVECFVQAILADYETLVLEYYDTKDTYNIVTGIGKRT